MPKTLITSSIIFFATALLVFACTHGSISAHDEPVDAEEQAGDPDGGDQFEPVADADAGGIDDAGDDAGVDSGDGFEEDGQHGDDAQPEDGDILSDDGPGPSSEMLLFDGDGRQFSYDDSGFHVLINPGDQLPADNWLDPVDYYNGEFHVRYVINSPADQPAGMLQTCIWTMGDDGVGGDYFPESCGQQVSHTGPGEYFVTASLSPAAWWKNGGVPLDYSHPERFLVRVVLRGESGCNVTRYNVDGACWDEWPNYENMNFRVTIVMVAAGESFSGWSNYP
ncbi:MAG TPA: hypothetical protein VM425_12515 [Myxococcota bacterium]|nr:hypothetical protein [Myxococcota bacterium]